MFHCSFYPLNIPLSPFNIESIPEKPDFKSDTSGNYDRKVIELKIA